MPLPAYPGLFKGQASLVSFDGTTALINVTPDDKTEGLMLSIPVPPPTEDKEPGITMQMVGRWPERAELNPVISHCIVANWRDSDGAHWIIVRLDCLSRPDFWLLFSLKLQ